MANNDFTDPADSNIVYDSTAASLNDAEATLLGKELFAYINGTKTKVPLQRTDDGVFIAIWKNQKISMHLGDDGIYWKWMAAIK